MELRKRRLYRDPPGPAAGVPLPGCRLGLRGAWSPEAERAWKDAGSPNPYGPLIDDPDDRAADATDRPAARLVAVLLVVLQAIDPARPAGATVH